jgi:hypothetical protein
MTITISNSADETLNQGQITILYKKSTTSHEEKIDANEHYSGSKRSNAIHTKLDEKRDN